MEMVLAQFSTQVGRAPRAVRQAIEDDRLAALRTVGRQLVVDDVAVALWRRSSAKGGRVATTGYAVGTMATAAAVGGPIGAGAVGMFWLGSATIPVGARSASESC